MGKTVAKVSLILVLICIIGFVALQTYADQQLPKVAVNPVQLPKYFEPVRWGEDGWLYGMMGSKFLRYQPVTGEWKLLVPHVWNGQVDQGGRFLAFIDENGLQYLDIKNGGGIKLIDSQSDLKIHTWSPDGKKLLYSKTDEWSSEYYIYDLELAEIQPYQFANVENFLSEPIYWRENTGTDQLLFSLRFSRSRTGEKEYRSGGYRSELYLGNAKGHFSPLVEVKDGEYLLVDSIGADGNTIYYHYYGQAGNVYECDLSTGQARLAWEFGQVKKVSISPESELAFLEKDQLELVDLNQNQTLHTFTFEYKRVIWSPDHRQALVYPSKESAVTTGYLVQLQQ